MTTAWYISTLSPTGEELDVSAQVTLPHGVGMAISGMYPHVMHGESLSIIYISDGFSQQLNGLSSRLETLRARKCCHCYHRHTGSDAVAGFKKRSGESQADSM